MASFLSSLIWFEKKITYLFGADLLLPVNSIHASVISLQPEKDLNNLMTSVLLINSEHQ